MSTLAEAFARLLAVLDRMEIPYEVGGSVASSAHGIPRTTLDVDIVVDLKPDQIDSFAAELSRVLWRRGAHRRRSRWGGRRTDSAQQTAPLPG
jgi:hypothetical protein